jgi:microcompartment protein CcmK/EutM
MNLGKVVGTIVASRKDEKLEGLKLLIVQFVSAKLEPTGAIVVAVDSVGAGVGEFVLVAAGSSARQTKTTEGKPVDTVIMAIVDIMEIGGAKVYEK